MNNIRLEDLIKNLEEQVGRGQDFDNNTYLSEFIPRVRDVLYIIENSAIEFEKDNENVDALYEIFTSLHNIKQAAEFVGQDVIKNIAYETKNLFKGCNKKVIKPDKDSVSLVLKSVEYMKKVCENPDLNNDEEFTKQIAQYIEELNSIVNNSNIDAIIEGNAETDQDTVNYKFLDEFCVEAKDHLENLENNVLSLEKTPDDKDLLDGVYRDFHTIKGLAGFAGQVVVQKLAHETETLLDKCRKGLILANKEIIDLILKTVDMIKRICSDVSILDDQEFLEFVYSHIQSLNNEEYMEKTSVPESSVKEDENTDEEDDSFIDDLPAPSTEEIDSEFLNDFIVEASDHLEKIEMTVFEMEKDPDNEEIVHSMFRSFHTIKGLAGFVEQTLIEELAHKTETLLDECRKKTIKADKNIADIILTSADYIKKICEDISLIHNKEVRKAIKKHLQKIKKAENVNDSGEPVEVEIPDDTPKLGEILVKEKKLKAEDIDGILEKQRNNYPELKFGEVAIQEEKVKPKDVLNAVRSQQSKTGTKEEYMRISTNKVDNLVDMVGELVITQSLVEQSVLSTCGADNLFANNFNRMTRITRDLQNIAMYLRMVSLKSTFQKITRIARDTINELGKDVDFSTSGDETEIDRIVTEKLLDPLVHLIKNAVSHGIEPVEAREKAGKPARGSVRLNAYNKRGNIYIEIIDDGGGIDAEKVYQKAMDKGIIDQNKQYSEEEIQEFIMLPGFSTMEVANNISGRGVGMDVVKTEIQKINGKIEIKSKKGEGSAFILKIPVNHAIMNGTVVDIDGSNYIIPTLNVKQIMQPREDQWVYIHNKRSRIKVRGDIIPLIPLPEILGKNEKTPELVIILELEQKYKALPVRNVIGRQEVVVKPVGEEFAGLGYIAGMSILGDGKVSLILDIENMFKQERS